MTFFATWDPAMIPKKATLYAGDRSGHGGQEGAFRRSGCWDHDGPAHYQWSHIYPLINIHKTMERSTILNG